MIMTFFVFILEVWKKLHKLWTRWFPILTAMHDDIDASIYEGVKDSN